MRFIWTIDPVDDIKTCPEPTREWLADLFRCHVNTIYNYEDIIKESLGDLKDAKKYYQDEDGTIKKWVELNGYLAWLICKVKALKSHVKGKNKREKIKDHFFLYFNYYTEESYQYEIQQQRREKPVQQPEQQPEQQQQTSGSKVEGKRPVAA